MVCNHERIKSVNCRLFCVVCGEELSEAYLTGKKSTASKQAAETPAEGQETAKKATRKRKA